MNEGLDILVTGADQRQGLAVIRSLGRHGISVVAAGSQSTSIGFYSQYTKEKWVYPSPLEKPAVFLESIIEAVKRFRIKLIMPVVESTLIILNEYREEIEKYAPLAAASREAVALCLDKKKQLTLAEQQGIPMPKTVTPFNLDEAEDLVQQLAFPLVVKPNVKSFGEREWDEAFKVSFIESWESLRNRLSIYYRYGVLPVVQELRIGEGIGFGVLMDRGKALGCYQYHRGREMLPTGGVPVRYESMPLWPNVKEYSVRLLQAMDWQGVAQVEWKRIAGTKEIFLMEVNGRYWASLPGAIHAGMDFPFWQYELFTGKTPLDRTDYRKGVASRYLRGDLKRLESVIGQKHRLTSVPLPSKKQECLEFISDGFRWRVKGDIHSWDDPMPGLREAGDLIKEYWGRFIRKVLKKVNMRRIKVNNVC